ncbi:hypothetical protein D3C87_279890 [compost metagenome]
MEIVSYETAISLGLKKYFTGIPCRKGHTAERYVNRKSCCKCAIESVKARTSSAEAKERKRIYDVNYRLENLDRIKSLKSETSRRYRLANKSKILADSKWRKYSLKRATPPWADRKQISSIYALAHKLTEETGVRYSVDHIVPIKGKHVCGLHAGNNLRVIPLQENVKKHNKFYE